MIRGWSWVAGASGGGASSSFTIIQTDTGTSPTATGPNDPLTIVGATGQISTAGSAITDTVTIGLVNSGVVAGSYVSASITVDSFGRITSASSSGAGTVTSVGLALPAIFTVSGSPVTTSGTLTGTLATQLANLIWAGPASGGAASPTFRSMVIADLPSSIPNSNLANSSISFATGTTGTDVNWSSSPVSLGGTATLNIPDASTTARGLVTTTTQTFKGEKTIANLQVGTLTGFDGFRSILFINNDASSSGSFFAITNQVSKIGTDDLPGIVGSVQNIVGLNGDSDVTAMYGTINTLQNNSSTGFINAALGVSNTIQNNADLADINLVYANYTEITSSSTGGFAQSICYSSLFSNTAGTMPSVTYGYNDIDATGTNFHLSFNTDVVNSFSRFQNAEIRTGSLLYFYEPTNTNYNALYANPSLAINVGWTLPVSDLDGAFCSDGSGAMDIREFPSSGSYTPTITGITNVSSTSSNPAQYVKIGGRVIVYGSCAIDPTVLGSTSVRLSLPIASNFGAVTDCNGNACASAIAGQSGGIYADTGNDEARLDYIAVDVTNQTIFYDFCYTII